jgi:hypothetical protein
MPKMLLFALVLLFSSCKKEAPPAYNNTFTCKVNGNAFEVVEIRSLILPLYIISGPQSFSVSGTDISGLSIYLSYYPYNNVPVSSPITYFSSANQAGGSISINGLNQASWTAGQFTITDVDKTTYQYHQVITGVFECSNLQASPDYIITEGKFSVKN